MVNRYLFIGFGAGLIFAAGFMFVFPTTNDSAHTLTTEQLQAAAELNKLALVPKAEYEKWQKEKQAGEANGINLPLAESPNAPVAPRPVADQTSPADKPATVSAKPGAEQPAVQSAQAPAPTNVPVSSTVSMSPEVAAVKGNATHSQVNHPKVTMQTPAAADQTANNAGNINSVQTHTTSVTAPGKNESQRETMTVTIPDGLTSTEVEAILSQSGILPENNQFVQKITAINKQRSIRAGKYTISKDPNIDQLIQLITTPPAQ